MNVHHKKKTVHARIQEFSSGGSRSVCQKKSSHNAFFFFFFFQSSAYFTEVKWPILKKSIIFKVPEGSNIFQGGGSNFFQGGPIAYSL